MDTIFKTDLTDLKTYNNLLIPSVFDDNKKVLISEYDTNLNPLSQKYTNSISLSSSNTYVNPIIIFSFIYISSEGVYKFKIPNGYSSAGCEIYLNNYNILNNESITDFKYLPQNVYLLTIKLKNPYLKEFILSYQQWTTNIILSETIINDSNWKNVNTLLLTSSSVINKKYLIPHFLVIDPKTTIYTNPNDTSISTFLTNIENPILDYYNNITNTTLTSPSPVDGIYGAYNISDTAWTNATNQITEYPASAIGISGKCLDVDNSTSYASGSKVQIMDCNNGNGQKFIYDPKTARIKVYANKTQCLDVDVANNNKLSTWECHEGNNQKFIYDQITGRFNVYGTDNKCLDLNNNNNTNGTQFSAGVTCGNNNNGQIFNFKDTLVSGGIGKDRNIIKNKYYQNPQFGGVNKIDENATITKSVGNIQGYTDIELQSIWEKNFGCSTKITDKLSDETLDSIRYLPYKSDNSEVLDKLASYKKNNIISNVSKTYDDSTLLKVCYRNNMNTGAELIKTIPNTNDSSLFSVKYIIYPGIAYTKGMTWTNGNATLQFQNTDSNLVLVNNGSAIWSTGVPNGGSNNYLIMQTDGNLVMYNNNGNANWHSDTSGTDVKYGYLTKNGYLCLMTSKNKIYKIYPDTSDNKTIKNMILNYFQNYHWDNSPSWMFSDAMGRMWKAGWTEFKQDYSIANITENLSKCGTQSACPFRGKRKSKDDTEWDVKDLDLKNVKGYDNTHSEGQYPDNKTSGDRDWNFNGKTDRTAFLNLQNNRGSTKYYPWRISGKSQTVFDMPGYDRKTDMTFDDWDGTWRWLVSNNGSDNDVSFMLWKKMDRSNYATDIWDNYRDLVKRAVKNNDIMNWIIEKSIGYSTNDSYDDNFLTRFTVVASSSGFENYKIKSSFINKLNNSIKENFNSLPTCDLTNILNDENCKSIEVNIYKDYINNMNNYCLYKNNSLSDFCLNYSNKEYKMPNNEIIKIDQSGKNNILNKQSNVCEDNINWDNDLCISYNINKPDVIKNQIEQLNKDDPLYTKLSEKYGNELLFQECLIDPLNTKCNELYTIDKYKDDLINKKNELCLNEENITKSKCLDYNLNTKEQLDKLTELCNADIKNKSCNDIYNLKQSDPDFQKTDIYNKIWMDRNQWWIILLAIVIFCSLIGGKLYFGKKKTKVVNTPMQSYPSAPPMQIYPQAPSMQSYPSASPIQSSPSATPMQSYPSAPPIQSYPSAPPIQSYPSAPPIQSYPSATML